LRVEHGRNQQLESRRQRTREQSDLERAGDEATRHGRHSKAYKSYLAAMQRCRSPEQQRVLQDKIDTAFIAVRRRRRRRWLVMPPLLLALLAGGVWKGGPAGHAWWAEYERASLDETDAAAVDAFCARHMQVHDWYRQVFQAGYDLPAIAAARAAHEQHRNRSDQAAFDAAGVQAVDALEAQAADATVPWVVVRDAAAEQLAQDDVIDSVRARVEVVHAQAQAAVAEAEQGRADVEAALAAGDVVAALADAAALRSDGRLSAPTMAALPWPAPLRVEAADGERPPGVRVYIDGVASAIGQEMAVRYLDRPAQLEVVAPGFVRVIRQLAPLAEPAAAAVEELVALDRGRAWTQQVDEAYAGPAALQMTDDVTVSLIGLDQAVDYALGDGQRQAVAEAPALAPSGDGGLMLGWQDGQALVARGHELWSIAGGAGRWRQMVVADKPVLAATRFADNYRADVMIDVVVGGGIDGSQLIASADGAALWSYDLSAIVRPAAVLHRHGRILVIGDQIIQAVDQEGRPSGTLTLPDRLGAAPLLFADGDHIALPLVDGTLRVVRLAASGDPIRLLAGELAAGEPVVAGVVADDGTAIFAHADRGLRRVMLADDQLVEQWSVQAGVGDDPVRSLVASGDKVLVLGEGGRVAVHAVIDGSLQGAVDHLESVRAAALGGTRLVLLDAGRRLAAYDLVAPAAK
jgi:hypothetical protein